MQIEITKPTLNSLNFKQLVELFDKYRMFYNQESNINLAEDFLKERIENNDSTIFIAVDKKNGNVAGFM